jgi:hypothetical protein
MTATNLFLFAICVGIFATNCCLLAIVAELKKQSPRHHRVHRDTPWRGAKRFDSSGTIGQA